MEPQATLHGATGCIVLHAVAEENLDVAVRHAHRYLDLHFAEGRLEQQALIGVQIDGVRGFVEQPVRVLLVIDTFGHGRTPRRVKLWENELGDGSALRGGPGG